MQIISPSILAADFLNLEQDIDVLNQASNTWIHLDIMDGHFVPNLTFGEPIVKRLAKKSDIPLDAHLMVTNPEFHIEQMAGLGIHNITFHFEAVDNLLELIQKAKKSYPSVGISIKPKTSVDDVSPEILAAIDLLLVMSVEPGFGGQKFIPNTWKKLDDIRALKDKHQLSFMVQVDGGINGENAPELWKKDAENLVAGSYVFKQGREQILQKIEGLRN